MDQKLMFRQGTMSSLGQLTLALGQLLWGILTGRTKQFIHRSQAMLRQRNGGSNRDNHAEPEEHPQLNNHHDERLQLRQLLIVSGFVLMAVAVVYLIHAFHEPPSFAPRVFMGLVVLLIGWVTVLLSLTLPFS